MRLIDADALKKDWSMANKCEECPQDVRKCQYEQDFSRMDICEMLDEATTVCGWISVKDRLPEEKINPLTHDFQDVICFCDFGGIPKRTDIRAFGYGKRSFENEPHFLHGPQIMDGVVTHWMPLPEPPKEAT